MKTLKMIGLSLMALLMVACANRTQELQTPEPQPTTPAEVKSDRPSWTMEEPLVEGDYFTFVGLSNIYATEKAARNDARRDSINSVISYIGTLAKSKWEEASVSYGLEGETIDPTRASRQFQKQMAANMATRLRVIKWHLEREKGSSGKLGYKYFALGQIPKASVNSAFQKTAAHNLENAQQKAAAAADAKAKAQAEKHATFWEEMTQQGLIE